MYRRGVTEKMVIDLTPEAREQQTQVALALGLGEILSQCAEECNELAIACNKVRRARNGTTPISQDDAIAMLEEEAGDVLLLLDYLEACGLLNIETAVESAKKKNTRWYGRTIG